MIYKEYDVELTLTEPLLGTVPKNQAIYSDYIAAKMSDYTAEKADEEVATVPPDAESGWTGFHSDAGRPFLYDYAIKGFIKEAGNTLKDQVGEGDKAKVAALRSKLDQFLFVFPRRIYLGEPPTEVFERPLRAMTQQGPRVALVKSDVIPAGRKLTFTLRVLKHPEITEKLLKELFSYGELKGLGQFRNGSFGRFTYELRARE